MSFRSLALQRCAVFLAAALIVTACSEDGRPVPLSEVDLVPPANAGPQSNQNINNPTLTVADNFEVSPGDTLTLVWSDEFDGASLDPEVWFFATGDGSEVGLPGGWGNNELQYYLPDSAQLENGVLKITARQETIGGLNYTSARLNTEDRFALKYGRIEASIKLPSGQGLWPAFWMLPQDSPYGEWAAKGEIDIVEAINLDGTNGNEIFATIHFGGEFPANAAASLTYTPGPDVTEDFHTYAIEWDEFEIRWYFDGSLYAVQNNWFSTAAPYPAPFDQPFHVLLNLAVGGNFPGFAVDSSVFPATMEVDWVRVYTGEEESAPPAGPGTIPDVVIFATDPNVPVDLVFGVDYTGFEPFGSGSVFDNNVAIDPDFNPSFGVTTGDGYGAQVGQFAIIGFAAGFATGYETLDFKAKGLNNDLIRVKFLDAGEYVDITLTNSGYSTDLGNGWYQVSVPLADFTSVDSATALLFETDNTAANAFQFLLTDFGFSGTSGGGGTVLATFDEVPPPAVTGFGGTVTVIEPGPAGGDGSNTLHIRRDGGEVWAGAWIAIPAIPSDAGTQTVSAEVYSPTAGIPMVAKAEYADNAGSGDVQANEAVVVGWQTLTWTFTNLNPAEVYNRFVLLPNLGTVDTATSYFFDNITLLEGGGGNPPVGDGTFVNGDFETGDFTGWTLTQIPDTRGSIALEARLVAAGDAAGTNDVLIDQVALAAGTIAPGDSIDVSFDLYGSLTGAGGVVFVEVIFLNGAGEDEGGRNFVGPAMPYVPSTTWTNYAGTVIAGTAVDGSQWDVSGGVTLELKAACGAIAGGCGVDASFDNVTFTNNAIIRPSPRNQI